MFKYCVVIDGDETLVWNFYFEVMAISIRICSLCCASTLSNSDKLVRTQSLSTYLCEHKVCQLEKEIARAEVALHFEKSNGVKSCWYLYFESGVALKRTCQHIISASMLCMSSFSSSALDDCDCPNPVACIRCVADPVYIDNIWQSRKIAVHLPVCTLGMQVSARESRGYVIPSCQIDPT